MVEEGGEQEAKRLKAMAEAKYKASNLKSALKYVKRAHRLCPILDGLSSMLTSFKILRAASKSATPDWYKILQAEPFSHFNTIKKQYKKLAFLLHPDKNPHLGSEEAFKLVNEGFRFLSDKIRRKEYDMKLRIRIQDEKMKESEELPVSSETFWTACSKCRLLHQFERKYLGHSLVCPSCRKSFEAVEVGNDEDRVRVRSERLKKRNLGGDERIASWISKSKLGNVGLGKRGVGSGELGNGRAKSEELKRKGEEESGDLKKLVGGGGEWSGGRLRKRMSSVGELMERSQPKRTRIDEEMMTLAEWRSEVKRQAMQEEMGLKLKVNDEKGKEKERKEKEKEKEKERERERKEKESGKEREEKERCEVSKKIRDFKVERNSLLKKSKDSGSLKRGALEKSRGLSLVRQKGSKKSDLGIMSVEDSDFYDFDIDRVERSFKQGQVWAMYADDDGMPRDYGLIDEVVSVNPFEVKMSWLDLQNTGDEDPLCLGRMGFHVSCGRFKVSRKTTIDSVNIFSHVVDCERAAREVYRIYPKKGSVWALYAESTISTEGRNLSVKDRERCYDIVVFLTTYSEMHGLSMAYLEKVDGFKTIFKRREIGSHAIRWLEKDEVRLFSHQIPARKLSGDEAPELLKDCWELDPASLPADLLTT